MRINLDDLERLGNAATAGPWEAYRYGNDWFARYSDGEDTSLGKEADAKFIAAARNNWQSLIDRVRELEAGAAAMREFVAQNDAATLNGSPRLTSRG